MMLYSDPPNLVRVLGGRLDWGMGVRFRSLCLSR